MPSFMISALMLPEEVLKDLALLRKHLREQTDYLRFNVHMDIQPDNPGEFKMAIAVEAPALDDV
jgi:hypothetical protein